MTVVKVVSSPSSKSPSSYSSSDDSKTEKTLGASSPSQLKSKSTKSPSSYASIDTEIEETVDVEQPSDDIESMSMMVFTSIDEGSLSMKTETDTDMIKDSDPVEPVVHYKDWDWDFDCYKGQEKMPSNRRALKGSVLRGTKKSTKKVSSPVCILQYRISHINACSCANNIHINICCTSLRLAVLRVRRKSVRQHPNPSPSLKKDLTRSKS